MGERQRCIQLLKEELKSGKKSEYQLYEFLEKKSVRQEFRESVILDLEKDKSVKVTRGGWFWRTRYFELEQPKGKRKSRRIENPKSWVGICPNPPDDDKLQYIMIDRIWLPDPRVKSNVEVWDDVEVKAPVFSLWANAVGNHKVRQAFVECAAKFDYSQYLTKDYYEKIPTSGYKVTDILGPVPK